MNLHRDAVPAVTPAGGACTILSYCPGPTCRAESDLALSLVLSLADPDLESSH